MGDSPEALQAHYQLFGRKEGRMANEHDMEAQLRRLFNAEEYGKLYGDVNAVFGGNEEAMFQHYLSYGLLEGRRPSNKVSQAAASAMKDSVVRAMESVGIEAVPGSVQVVEILTGEIPADAGGAAVQQALAQAAPAIERAVSDTVEEVNNPTRSSSSSSSSKKKGWTEKIDKGSYWEINEYNADGLLIKKTFCDPADGSAIEWEIYEYDSNGNLVKTSYGRPGRDEDVTVSGNG